MIFGKLNQPISEDAIFHYFNNRFLVDEKQQSLKRRVNFEVRELCDLVVSLIKYEVIGCQNKKIEGGFKKALLITIENGMEVVAKIPCEAAVLRYGVFSFPLP